MIRFKLSKEVIIMFHMHRKRKLMNMEIPDMNMPDMSSTTKVLVAGAMVYFGAKMLMEEMMD